MKFRIITIFYAMALFATAIAAFGPWGVPAAGGVMAFWIATYYSKSSRTLVEWLVIAGVVVVLVALLLPSVRMARGAARRAHCVNLMKQLSLALYLFDEDHGTLPRIHAKDDGSKHEHSWRTHILPYLEHRNLYEAIDLTKPWDSIVNKTHCNTDVDSFMCPAGFQGTSGRTSYYAVHGIGTLFPPDGPRSLRDVPDGADRTIMLIEGPADTPWAEPKDLSIDEAVKLLSAPLVSSPKGGHHPRTGHFYKPSSLIRNVAMADGSVVALDCPIDPQLAQALLTADGGEAIDEGDFRTISSPRLDYGKVVGLAAFILLALVPAPRSIARSLAKQKLAGESPTAVSSRQS